MAARVALLGVNLRDLFPRHPVAEDWYHDKRIAVDGHNVAFRYLTSIRGKDGDVLRNRRGRATSHIIGFMGLVRFLRQAGAEPIVIWDGPTHPRKQATVDARIEKRRQAMAAAEAAKEMGDMDAYRRYLRSTTYLDGEMIDDCTDMLRSVGVAVMRADHDGERFAAALCRRGHADAVATEDYDALVAGAPFVLRQAGSPNTSLHRLDDLDAHGIDLHQLRQVAILCGTDWHPGVKGFGVKTALKAIRECGDLSRLVRQAEAGEAPSRYHKLVQASGLDADTYEDLLEFVAQAPQPVVPACSKPDPEGAASWADEMGIERSRIMASFC